MVTESRRRRLNKSERLSRQEIDKIKLQDHRLSPSNQTTESGWLQQSSEERAGEAKAQNSLANSVRRCTTSTAASTSARGRATAARSAGA